MKSVRLVAILIGLVSGSLGPSDANRADAAAPPLPWIEVAPNGEHFRTATSHDRFVVWGVNYDHDQQGNLLDEYWDDEFARVAEDFQEIKTLGANCVRVHLQFGALMQSPSEPRPAALERLAALVDLAERTGLYLDITGLACYHKKNIPEWYDSLDESARWDAQAVFWSAVARVCRESPAVFCYDLMNEPILPGAEPETDWLAGDLDGKYFVQRISLDLAGRTRQQVAKAWVEKLTSAIRQHDQRHLITVGVIPWVFVFGGGSPLFHGPDVGQPLDFVAVHFYPEREQVDQAVQALKAYDAGKPIVIEETFPLKCSQDELLEFIDRSEPPADGWISFYWGTPPAELETLEPKTIGNAITANWLRAFSSRASELRETYPGSWPSSSGTP